MSEVINFDEEYHKIVLLFNAGVNEPGSTYYWDDIIFEDETYIETSKIKELSFVQNPVQETSIINSNIDFKVIKIYSMTGQEIQVRKVGNNSFDVSKLRKGIYTVYAINKNGDKFSGKIFKD